MFVLLEFLGKLFWRKSNDREYVYKKKKIFLERIEYKNIPSCVIDIMKHLQMLNYDDLPDYKFIKRKLEELADEDSISPDTTRPIAAKISDVGFKRARSPNDRDFVTDNLPKRRKSH